MIRLHGYFYRGKNRQEMRGRKGERQEGREGRPRKTFMNQMVEKVAAETYLELMELAKSRKL